MKMRKALIFSWALYDLANQFFAMNVVSLYFIRWLTIEKHMPEVFYSISFGVSTFFMAVASPILGTVSDISQRRRPFLVWLTLIAIIFTAFLGIVKSVFWALTFFAIANFGYQVAVVFYNAMLANIAPRERIGFVSGFGRMLAYSGAILSLFLIKPIVLANGYQATFIPTAVLFLIFSLPCMLFIKDKDPARSINLASFFKKEKIFEIFKNMKGILANAHNFPGLLDFLKGSFFGLCAVNVVILFMSVFAAHIFKFNESQIINLIAFSTIFAIIGSIFSGVISDYIGYKRCIMASFILWGVCFVVGALARDNYLYWIIGALVGVALGSIFVVARALAIHLVPPERIGEIFGLFNFVGYLASIIGSLFWGILVLFLSHLGEIGYRIALLSLTLFMLLGVIFLWRIPSNLSGDKWQKKI